MASLKIAKHEYKLENNKSYLVGRKTSNAKYKIDIPIECDIVDHKHALIEVKDDNIELTDLNSNEGTIINNVVIDPMRPIRIEDGVVVTFGCVTALLISDLKPKKHDGRYITETIFNNGIDMSKLPKSYSNIREDNYDIVCKHSSKTVYKVDSPSTSNKTDINNRRSTTEIDLKEAKTRSTIGQSNTVLNETDQPITIPTLDEAISKQGPILSPSENSELFERRTGGSSLSHANSISIYHSLETSDPKNEIKVSHNIKKVAKLLISKKNESCQCPSLINGMQPKKKRRPIEFKSCNSETEPETSKPQRPHENRLYFPSVGRDVPLSTIFPTEKKNVTKKPAPSTDQSQNVKKGINNDLTDADLSLYPASSTSIEENTENSVVTLAEIIPEITQDTNIKKQKIAEDLNDSTTRNGKKTLKTVGTMTVGPIIQITTAARTNNFKISSSEMGVEPTCSPDLFDIIEPSYYGSESVLSDTELRENLSNVTVTLHECDDSDLESLHHGNEAVMELQQCNNNSQTSHDEKFDSMHSFNSSYLLSSTDTKKEEIYITEKLKTPQESNKIQKKNIFSLPTSSSASNVETSKRLEMRNWVKRHRKYGERISKRMLNMFYVGKPIRSRFLQRRKSKTCLTKIKVALSMTQSPEDIEKIVETINHLVTIVDDPTECDVLIMGKGNRTYKFIVTLARGKPIVSVGWLKCVQIHQSIINVKPEHFLADKDFEQYYNFNLMRSLYMANCQKILNGFTFLMTPNILPTPTELEIIIQCAGGVVYKNKELAKEKTKIYLVSSNQDRALWHSYKIYNEHLRVIKSEAVLLAIIQQRQIPLIYGTHLLH